MLCVVQDWLRAENLLPHQTVEKLSKWTVYDDESQARTVPAHNGRGPWESEDPTQEMLESRLVKAQVLILHHYNDTLPYEILLSTFRVNFCQALFTPFAPGLIVQFIFIHDKCVFDVWT